MVFRNDNSFLINDDTPSVLIIRYFLDILKFRKKEVLHFDGIKPSHCTLCLWIYCSLNYVHHLKRLVRLTHLNAGSTGIRPFLIENFLALFLKLSHHVK
jgi:hypothetical protein